MWHYFKILSKFVMVMISLGLHLQHPCDPSGCQYGVCDLKPGWHYLPWLTLVFVSSQSPRILLTLGCDKQLFSEIEDKTPQQNQGVYKTEAMALVNLHSLVGTLENMVLKLNSPEVTSLWSFSLERCPAVCLMIELKQLKYGLDT